MSTTGKTILAIIMIIIIVWIGYFVATRPAAAPVTEPTVSTQPIIDNTAPETIVNEETASSTEAASSTDTGANSASSTNSSSASSTNGR